MPQFDLAIGDDDRQTLDALPPEAWFTPVAFQNWRSPQPPALANLAGAHERKRARVDQWMARVVRGRSVLDTFSANGAFSFLSAQLGAREVLGVEWDHSRVAAAQAVNELLRGHHDPAAVSEFLELDVYELAARLAPRRFDVSLCLGGLYHVADPAHVLRQISAVTNEWLIVQTSSIQRGRQNRASFRVRAGGRRLGMTSMVAGSGKWDMTASCFRALLAHARFDVVEEYVAPPAYAALCRVIDGA